MRRIGRTHLLMKSYKFMKTKLFIFIAVLGLLGASPASAEPMFTSKEIKHFKSLFARFEQMKTPIKMEVSKTKPVPVNSVTIQERAEKVERLQTFFAQIRELLKEPESKVEEEKPVDIIGPTLEVIRIER